MKTPKNASDRKANSIHDLIRECDRLLNPETTFSMEELAEVQYNAVHSLLRLGSDFDAIRVKIEELRFSPRTEPLWRLARTGEQIHFIVPGSWTKDRAEQHITGTLNQLKDLMATATARQKETPPPTKRKGRVSTGKRTKNKHRKKLSPSQFRASKVAKVIREIDHVRPQMFGESDYERLAKQYPLYIIFRVTKDRADLRLLLLNVQAHRRHYFLAQQIVAAFTGMKVSTVQQDWKKHKPLRFRRPAAK